MAKDDDALPLPPDLAQLEHIASAADAQLDGAAAALVPGEAPPPEVDETAEVAGALTLIATIGGMAIPPLAEVYDAAACQAIPCSSSPPWARPSTSSRSAAPAIKRRSRRAPSAASPTPTRCKACASS